MAVTFAPKVKKRVAKFFVFIAIMAGFILLVDLYAFLGIRQLTHSLDPIWRKVARVAFWIPTIITFGLFASLLIGMESFMEKKTYGYFFFVAGFAFLFFIPKLIFCGFHFADDITHLVRTLFHRAPPAVDSEPAERMSRVQFFNQIGLGVSAFAFGSLLYGLTKGKFAYRILRESLAFEKLPAAFNGLRIVQISDAHLGSFLDNNFDNVQKGLDMINDLKPDLIVFTGDMVNNFAYEAEAWIPYFQKLQAPLGKFSILGNHDYGDYVFKDGPEDAEKREANLNRLKEIHSEMGFRLLLNENVEVENKGEFISLIGIENWGRGRFSKYGDLTKSMAGLRDGSFRILLSHDPTHWEDEVMGKQDIHLTFSGHTHGAQMGLESPMLHIKFSPSPWFGYKRWAGLYEEGGQFLYVNRGFGFLGFPGRVGMPPEITLVELSAKV